MLAHHSGEFKAGRSVGALLAMGDQSKKIFTLDVLALQCFNFSCGNFSSRINTPNIFVRLFSATPNPSGRDKFPIFRYHLNNIWNG